MKDPKFLEAANKQMMDINPIGGQELQGIVGKIVSVQPKVVEMIKGALKINDVTKLQR